MQNATRMRFQIAVITVAPAALLVGFVYHPYIGNATDESAIAAAATDDTTRWGIAHLLVGIAYGLLALAFVAVRTFLRDSGDERSSVWALPFAVMGCALFPILTGMEFALVSAARTGSNVEAAQTELTSWFLPIVATGAVCFAVGAIGFAIAIVRTAVVPSGLAWTAAGALVVMAAARVAPLGAAQILIGVAGVVAFWSLAWVMWKAHTGESPARPAVST